MTIEQLNRRHVCIVGFGREGQAALRAIERYAPEAEVTVADKNEDCHPEPACQTDTHSRGMTREVQWQLGENYLSDLAQYDVVIVSPGVPPSKELEALSTHVTTGMQIFFDTAKESGAQLIGVTGSKGKSTVSSLIYAILKADSRDVHLVGNIGQPALDYLDSANANTIFVCELSSYQLMRMTVSPHVAVLTTFFPEHLDYHGSLDRYREAKQNIAQYQSEHDCILYNADFSETQTIATKSRGTVIPYHVDDAPVDLDETHLIGEHNRSNIAGAWKVAEHLGVNRSIAAQVIITFEGLPHRLQSIGVHHGIEWIDDAISTTPESTIAALDALEERVTWLILGGQDRGYDFTLLAQRIAQSSIETVILFPDSGQQIKEALLQINSSLNIVEVETMEQAVDCVQSQFLDLHFDTHIPVALLSPASPSYNQFRNFEEKGNTFAHLVKQE